MKSMKLEDIIKVLRPTYIYLKLTPDTSIRNYNSTSIIKSINYMYKTITQRIHKEQKTLLFETPIKCSYLIDIRKTSVDFYFIVPQQYISIAKEKIRETWNKCTIEEIANIQEFSSDAIRYQLNYKKEDALSLNVDKKSNEPLNAILNVIDIMEDTDRCSIFYNFIPNNQLGWKKQYKDTIDKLNKGIPLEREKFNGKYIGKMALVTLIGIFDSILEVFQDFSGGVKKNKNQELGLLSLALDTIHNAKELSASTKKKKDSMIINTQIAVLSESADKIRKQNNALAVCQAYKVTEGDNELVYKRLPKSFKVADYNIGSEINKTSIDECQNFIQLPGRDLLQQFKIIQKVDTLEIDVPELLRTGYIYLGECTVKGVPFKAYLRDAYNYGNLPLLLLAPQGSGKTTFLCNMNKNIRSRKECSIVLDWIKNCELSDSIKKTVQKEDIIEIDLSNNSDLQSFAFNELKYIEGESKFSLADIANMKAEQTLAFIDSINTQGEPLSPTMRRYLSAACNVVYLDQNASIGDVISCLDNHKKRHYYIDVINELLDKEDQEIIHDDIEALLNLDEVEDIKEKQGNKNVVVGQEIVGTRTSKIEGILDRVNLLKENRTLKVMFNMSSKNNIDFVKAMDEGKTVLIKMPEDKFYSKMVKNIIGTFFTSKIVLCAKIRGSKSDKPSRVNVFYDEIDQAPTTEIVLNESITQLRKFGIKVVIATHSKAKLNSVFADNLIQAGASVMLLKGCNDTQWKEFKSILEHEGFDLEDLLNLKEHHSLNIIYYENGRACFITKLPPV
jgi:hypothetical protein